MVRPEKIDEDFAFEVFQLAKEIDPGFATDFAYGFVTGISPEDVQQYVENVMAYESGRVELNREFRVVWRTGEGAVGAGIGGWGDQHTQDVVELFGQLGFDATRIDSEQLSKLELLSELTQTGVVEFLLHGQVVNIELCAGESFLAEDIPELQEVLFVLNAGCYGGCTGKWYDQCGCVEATDYAERARYVDPSLSLSLNFLRNGTLAYFGHMCMKGDNHWPVNLAQALAANNEMTTGEMLKVWYDVPSGPNVVEGPSGTDLAGMDWNRFAYSSVILYGDPAVRILLR
jgi:hypothetical protein